jgi:hypothetical protein
VTHTAITQFSPYTVPFLQDRTTLGVVARALHP